jgi:succinate dehydrogenase / fumarate reductase, cytochrome b subunit
MAKSALLKSSIAKKYWMALTGLFLCLFLAGHLAGNLQLLLPNAKLQFNEYALFMTTNPAVKILSYVTYISILFHAIDGILLTIQNKKARPVGYAKENPASNSGLASRNMAVLGTLILLFIVLHMNSFWAKMHFSEMPLQTISVEDPMSGTAQELYVTTNGSYQPVQGTEIRNKTEIFNPTYNIKLGEAYKDLYKITIDFFKDPKYGLAFTSFYVLSMLVLGFHLWHGFQSSFQSLGLRSPKYYGTIVFAGKAFSVVVPLLFAIIPIYIHFILKT